MEMKFIFVPDNHDVTNPKMHQIWREKFGREWYSFDYKGVHFVCLNSEDPSAHIGDEQLQWLEADLRKNADARWTLLFFHKSIWTTSERDQQAGNPDSTNWSKVAGLLGERPHTVFAGHVHHYVQYERNGRHYYSLTTTGGSSPLRGVPYGEFDHITWLTMEQDGPRVANLLLDGIQPASVVTEQSIERFRGFLQAAQISVDPILISGDEIQTGGLRIALDNKFDLPITIQGKVEGLPVVGLTMESQAIELRAEWTDCEVTDFRGRIASEVRCMGRRTEKGYEIEMSMPITRIVEQQGAEWSSIQAGVQVRDMDASEDEPLEVLWHTSGELRDSRPLAHFIRK